MPEQPEPQNVSGNIAQSGAPPTQGGNHFTISMNATEINVCVGQSRILFGPNGVVPSVEWFLNLSISPTAALQLVEGLQQTVKLYEENFGAIPRDPNLKRVVSGTVPKSQKK